MTEPRRSRPHMPGYGILGADEGTGLLPWSWARERLERSHDYWVATVWPDGRPHLMPVWGVWSEGALWFSSSPGARKTRNLEARDDVVVATDDARRPVVVEGRAARVVDGGTVAAFTDLVNAKYGTELAVDFFTANACLRVTPRRVIGLDDDDFAGSPTRWEFDPGD